MAETRSNEAHDPYGNPQGLNAVPGTSPDAATGPSRNRPATGAREASAPPPSDSGWSAGLGATDFLGLEPDLRASGPEAEGGSGPTESWLFDIEQAEHGSSVTAVASATAAHPMSDVEADDGSGDGAFSSSDDPMPASADDSDLDTPEPAAPRRGAQRVLVSLALLAAVSAGGWFAWQRYGPRPVPAGPEVAIVAPKPAPTRPTPAQPEPSAKPVEPPITAVAQPEPAAPVATEVSSAPPEVAPPTETVAAIPDTAVPSGTPETVVRAEPAPVAVAQPAVAPEPALARSPDGPAKSPELPTGNPGPGGGRHATARDWAGMWLEPTIPSDAIRGTTRLRTLNVGLVRAELVNGEFVEGRLHAVGESRIWLDVKLGRMSFDAADVRDLVQIVGAQGQPLPLGAQAVAGLPRVEVLLLGGSITGHVLGREGDRVTFLTEDGMRLRVEALDVRPAPNGRSRLVGPVAARKP